MDYNHAKIRHLKKIEGAFVRKCYDIALNICITGGGNDYIGHPPGTPLNPVNHKKKFLRGALPFASSIRHAPVNRPVFSINLSPNDPLFHNFTPNDPFFKIVTR